MVRKFVSASIVLSGLAGCTVVPDEEPVSSITLKGNYTAVADCSFIALQHNMGQLTSTKLESRHTVQIARGDTNLILWTVEISDAGSGSTSVVFRSRQAIWGRDFYANQVMPSILTCAA